MNTSKKYKTVYTVGVFDLLHYGHINLLNRAKDFGDRLVVGLVDDKAVKTFKGKGRPILPYEDRKKLLLSIKSVSEVIKQEDFDILPPIGVDLIVKGNDQEHLDESIAIKENIPIVYLERTKGISTTELVKCC